MILLLGDIHENIASLYYAIQKAQEQGAVAVIQVGDFGLFGRDGIPKGFHKALRDAKIPVYFIDGNHDDCTRWVACEGITRIFEDRELFYVPRGTVMEIDGRTIAFMGGAGSIDKAARLKYGWQWDENENISPHEVLRLMENVKDKKIDVLITHGPPNSVVDKHFDPLQKLAFDVSIDWQDHNLVIIDHIWKALGYPDIYSGHMHKRISGYFCYDENDDSKQGHYRILDIYETFSM